MDCFLCGGRRKTKRVTVPPGTNTLFVGPAAHATQQQQALGPCEYQLCLAHHLHFTVHLDIQISRKHRSCAILHSLTLTGSVLALTRVPHPAMQMQPVYPLAGSTLCSAIYISIVSFRQPLLTSVNAILLGKVDLGECTRDGYLMAP